VIEVHSQKRYVLGYIETPEPVIELNAVNYVDAVLKKNVSGVQVAVTVFDTALASSAVEYVGPRFQKYAAVRSQIVEIVLRQACADVFPGLLEVFLNVPAHHVNIAELADFRACGGFAVEVGYPDGYAAYVIGRNIIVAQTLIERFVEGQLAHFQSVLNDFAAALYLIYAVLLANRHDAFVNVGGQPAVQLDFALAVVTPLFESGEIEESHVNGLLHLVNEAAREKQV
jgi:hypothetical protein